MEYAFQDLADIPDGFVFPEGRTKPWGTGQAILAARDYLDAPFAAINADDYYGKMAFQQLYDWLCLDHGPTEYSLVGFVLKNTLSDIGGVTRGICSVDGAGYLTDVVETSDIVKTSSGAAVNGVEINPDSPVSMNMWGLTEGFIPILEQGYVDFFREDLPASPMKLEYLLPVFIGKLLREKKVSVQVLETKDSWFGITYREDMPPVINSTRQLINSGVYQEDLFGDLQPKY